MGNFKKAIFVPLQVKLAMLNYLNVLVPCMDPSDFMNSSDTRLVVSRIVTWTNEPKNIEVRKVSQQVTPSLLRLNPMKQAGKYTVELC